MAIFEKLKQISARTYVMEIEDPEAEGGKTEIHYRGLTSAEATHVDQVAEAPVAPKLYVETIVPDLPPLPGARPTAPALPEKRFDRYDLEDPDYMRERVKAIFRSRCVIVAYGVVGLLDDPKRIDDLAEEVSTSLSHKLIIALSDAISDVTPNIIDAADAVFTKGSAATQEPPRGGKKGAGAKANSPSAKPSSETSSTQRTTEPSASPPPAGPVTQA